MEVDKLQPQDEKQVKEWLYPFIFEHLEWWSKSYQLNWDHDRIADHIKSNNLVDSSFDFILKASRSDTDFVRTLKDEHGIFGIVHAQVKTDDFTKFKSGRIQWICVETQKRDSGYGKILFKEAHKWMQTKQLVGADIFVNSSNKSALLLYTKLNYQISDYQMRISSKLF